MNKKIIILILIAWCGLGALRAQTVVTGVVTEEGSGAPVSYASVMIKGTTVAVNTDTDGKYSIRVPAGDATLVFSFIGMETLEEPLNGRTVINVVLQSSQRQLDEIVVIGYGSEKKKNIAGAVSNIRADELSKASVENFQKAMQGKAAGVQITSANGAPGGAVEILIRGRGSLNGSVAPLYVIDGIQVATGNYSSVLASSDPLAGLSMDDIESIDILKDGASAAIYGAQAANGVIFITTKKGAAGKTKISFKSTFGWQQVGRQIPTLNGPETIEMFLLINKNTYGETGKQYTDLLSAYQQKGWGNNGFSNAPTYDWFDAVFRTGSTQDYQLSLSGGNEKTNYYLSAGYMKDNGIIINTWFKRASARLNMTHKLAKWLTFSTNSSFSNVNQKQLSTTGTHKPARMALLMQATNPIYNPDGSYNVDNFEGYNIHNVVQYQDLNNYAGTTNKWVSANDFTIHNLIEGLSFKSSYGIDYLQMREDQFVDPRTRYGRTTQGTIWEFNTHSTRLQTDQVFTYQNVFNDIHRINAVAGFSFITANERMVGAGGTGIADPSIKLVGATAIPLQPESFYTEWKTIGLFARVAYTLQDKYILSAIIRRDGSSRFGTNNKFGTFPSISAAWRVSEESFMKGISFINDFKLKASYGVTGNSDFGSDFAAWRIYQASGGYNGLPAVYPYEPGNNMLTWEESHTTNLGFTAQLFDNRISLDVDFYNTDTKNLLFRRPIPNTTGYTEMQANMGGVRNRGVEFLINTENVKTRDFVWTTNLNFAFTKNEVSSLFDDILETEEYKVGESSTAVKVFNWAGVNPSDGRPMYYDKDGYIVYTPNRNTDRIWLPGRDPKFFGGITNTLAYAGVELAFTFQFQQGARSRWSDKQSLIYYDADSNMLRDLYTQHWSQPGDHTWVAKPMLSGIYPNGAYQMATSGSSLIYEKTDYIKLKMVSLSYNLPKEWISKANLSGAQIYAHAYNLWTTTTYPGYDPEFVGSDSSTYPQSRIFSIGIKLDF
jgi:TonB-linked SusC/RagA family outer membrane protein